MNTACSSQERCFRIWRAASQFGPWTIVSAKSAMS